MNNKYAYWFGKKMRYQYEIHELSLPFKCDPKLEGNYIFCKLVNQTWEAIYIGEGILYNRINDPEHSKCVLKKHATHIHYHLSSNERIRKDEEEDLLDNHPEVYEPNGCNKY